MNITIPLADYIAALLGPRMEAIIDLELADKIRAVSGWEQLVAIEPTCAENLKRMIKRSYFELCRNPVVDMSTAIRPEREPLIAYYIERMLIMGGGKINRSVFEGLAKNMSVSDLKKFKEMNI